MPISLRLPAEVESQIAGFSARQGVSKSALIVRSIQEFLARHAQPTSLEIYQDAMRQAEQTHKDAKRKAAEQRPHKALMREAIARKHAQRSERALTALNKRRKRKAA
jgi:hypothetical protein